MHIHIDRGEMMHKFVNIRSAADPIQEVRFWIGEFVAAVWPLTLLGLMWLGWVATFMFVTLWAIPFVRDDMTAPPAGTLPMLYFVQYLTVIAVILLSVGIVVELMRGRRPKEH